MSCHDRFSSYIIIVAARKSCANTTSFHLSKNLTLLSICIWNGFWSGESSRCKENHVKFHTSGLPVFPCCVFVRLSNKLFTRMFKRSWPEAINKQVYIHKPFRFKFINECLVFREHVSFPSMINFGIPSNYQVINVAYTMYSTLRYQFDSIPK